MSAHSKASLGARHPTHNWEVAGAAARDALSVTAEDVGKIAKLTAADNGAFFWILRDHTGPTWEPLDNDGGAVLSNTAPVDVTKAPADAGVANEGSRQDHKHDVSTAAPGATGVATVSGEGTATSLARSDHTHQANTAPADVTKAAAAIGTSGEPARADHKHDVSTAAAASIAGTNTEGVATSLARSDHGHALANNVVDNAALRDSAGQSVIGKPGTGSGDPSDIVAGADNQILHRASGTVQFGALTDTLHGTRGGGTQHAAATSSVAGFMSAADKAKLDNLSDLIKSHVVYADQMGVSNIDFPVNNIAPTDLDNTNSRFPVVVYDDTLEQIRWWGADSPGVAYYGVAADQLLLKILMKPETAPPAARTVGLRLYYSNVPDDAAVPAWRSIDLDDFDIAANTNWQEQLFTITIGGGVGELDIMAGQALLLGLARIDPTAGAELVGNAHMLRVVEGWGVS